MARHALSKWNVFGERHGGVIELLEVVHPDLGGAASVACEDVATAPGERVGVLLPEDVTHPAAGDDFQAAAALPHSEGNFWKCQFSLGFKVSWRLKGGSE